MAINLDKPSDDLPSNPKHSNDIPTYSDTVTDIIKTDIKDLDEKLESKKVEPITVITNFETIGNYADGPCLQACQELYIKGIHTFCSNYVPTDGYITIHIHYNSLSDENKNIIKQLIKTNPKNYIVKLSINSYYGGKFTGSDEIDENKIMEVVIGFDDLSGDISIEETEKLMKNLTLPFVNQIHMDGVYTREELILGKHKMSNFDSFDTSDGFWWGDYSGGGNDDGWGDKCEGFESVESISSEEQIKTEKKVDLSLLSNEEIASQEGLSRPGFSYSQKYNLFFGNYLQKSRYIESLYRKDGSSTQSIVEENGLVWKDGMFFESEEDLKKYIELTQK